MYNILSNGIASWMVIASFLKIEKKHFLFIYFSICYKMESTIMLHIIEYIELVAKL